MDFPRVFMVIILYLTFFTLLGSLFNMVQFPPPPARYTLFTIDFIGDVVISLSLFDPYFVGTLVFVALMAVVIGAIPFVSIDSRFVTSVAIGVLLVVALGIMLDGSMVVLPWVFRVFFVWLPIFALGVSMFAMLAGGRGG